MSLLDLKSDLSKYRWKGPGAPVDPNSKTPRATSYGDNFGSFQPISNTFIKSDNLPKVIQPKDVDLIGKLDNTRLDNINMEMKESNLVQKLENSRLDDIQKPQNKNILINSVSSLSPDSKISTYNPFRSVSTEEISSELGNVNENVSQSNITKSDVVVLKQTTPGENNTRSDVDIRKRDNQIGNVKDPNVVINRTPLFINRESQSAVVIKDLRNTTDNITDPAIPITPVTQTIDRQNQSPRISTKDGLSELLVDNEASTILKESILDVVGTPLRYSTDSKLVLKQTPTVDSIRYDQVSDIITAPSGLNLDNKVQTIPDGRHNTDEKTELSNKKGQEIDFFPNNNAEGFTNNIQSGVSEYKQNSSTLDYDTLSEANYFDITNRYTTDGFHAFASTGEPTKYKDGASQFDWDGDINKAPLADYLDIGRNYTSTGFHALAKTGEPTKYKIDSSIFDWDGIRGNAPSVDYFDITNRYTIDGFHNFAIEYDTKYINGSSRFDWDGIRNDAPSVDYFDLSKISTIQGFHNFAQTKEPTSYSTALIGSVLTLTTNASFLDWDGVTAPAVNYFDQNFINTWRGFHAFATTLEPTSYANTTPGQPVLNNVVTLTNGATRFDWDGTRISAPAVNYFDLTNQRTWRGFHTFATTLEPTSYANTAPNQTILNNVVTLTNGATAFDWNGVRVAAPAVNFFDFANQRTWRGFHTFATTLEPTSYANTTPGQPILNNSVTLTNGATAFDWNGLRATAPAVNFFDLFNLNTWRGFHTFATTLEPTSYANTAAGQPILTGGITLTANATNFGWNGLRANAPTVDYFDNIRQRTNRGFHSFATTLEPTSYQTIQVGFTSVLNPAASNLDWNSVFLVNTPQQPGAPTVNYFDTANRSTTRGFHSFATTGEPTSYRNIRLQQGGFGLHPDASFLDWNGTRASAPTVNYFPNFPNGSTTRGFHSFAQTGEPTSYATVQSGNIIALRANTTRFDWNGSSTFAPTVNYFDQNGTATSRGFHTFATTLEPTSYQTIQVGLTSVLNPAASNLDWNSIFLVNTPQQPGAPAVNYFDRTNRSTTRGFHVFAQTGEPTSYRTVRHSGGGFGLHPDASFLLDWNGSRNNAPGVNYFGQFTNATINQGGFRQFFSGSPTTRYNTGTFGTQFLANNATQFDWDGGTPQNAPTVNFFDQNNISTTRGFHRFASTVNGTAYRVAVGINPTTNSSANFIHPLSTQFDWNGLDPYSMRTTNFFGFTNTTRFGFMVNMSQFDGTAYPIINPLFNANILRIQGAGQRTQRFGLNLIRQIAQPLQTRNLEQFAPLTFSGKTISGFRSTLDVQTPAVIVQKLNLNIATNRVRINPTGTNFSKRYTSGGGVDIRPSTVDGTIESWANPNIIDSLQQKYSLRQEAYNDDLIGIYEPYIDGSRYGDDFIRIPKFDEGLARGGVIANSIRTGLDLKRIGKFLISGRGILWNIKQSGLQAMNPNVDSSPSPASGLFPLGFSDLPTQQYNPLSVPSNILGNSFILGRRFTRHGFLMDGKDGSYEKIAIERALNTDKYERFDKYGALGSPDDYNRLIGLVKELLPNSYGSFNNTNIPQKNTTLEIKRISTNYGGPNSILGFFGTKISRATHPFKVVNTTEYFPTRNNINLGIDREVFFSAKFGDNNKQTDTYSAMLSREMEEYDGDMYGLILQAAKSSQQKYTPNWEEDSKNRFNGSSSRIQIMTRGRIQGSKVFDFKKPSLTERLNALNFGYVPYRDKNESLAEEIFFLGREYEETYYDRLFGQTDGEYTQYGNIYGLILGATVGSTSTGILPKFVDGRQQIDKTEFKVPLNKYDRKRIEELDIYAFKEVPIYEHAKPITSQNISPRKDLNSIGSDVFFVSTLIDSKLNTISRDSYSNYLIASSESDGGSDDIGANTNEFSLGILGSIALSRNLEGIYRSIEGLPSLEVEYSKIPINSKTKDLLQKIKPFEFIAPPITDRYKAITSENAYRDGENLYDETFFGTARSKYDVLTGQRVDNLSYGAKLKDDWADKNSRAYGLVLTAATVNLKKTSVKSNGQTIEGTIDSGGPVWNLYSGDNYDGNATNEAYPSNEIPINSQTVDRLRVMRTFDFKYPNPYERFNNMSVLPENYRERNNPMANGPDVSGELVNPLLRYKTTTYEDLGRIQSFTQPADFRQNIIEGSETFSTDPRVVDYKKYNVELKGDGTGFGNPGLPGQKKNLPYITNIDYRSGIAETESTKYADDQKKVGMPANRKYAAYPMVKDEIDKLNPNAFRGDRINVIDWKRSEQNINVNTVYEKITQQSNKSIASSQDLIQFYFSGVDLIASQDKPTEAIVFRAHLDAIVDNHKPTWTPIKYIGRADPVYSYDGYEREISFGFTVHTGTRDELKATWRKLNMLASWTTPDYIDPGFMKAPICRLNIGNLYRKFPGFISSLTYTFDNSMTTWETAKLAEDLNISDPNIGKLSKPGALELPKTILVQCTFVTFNIYRPQWDCVFYSLFDDTTGGTNVETGLVPMSDDRVNYFKTHDDLPVTHPMNALLCAVIPPPPEVSKSNRRKPAEDTGTGPGPSTTPPPTTPPPSSTPPPTTGPVLPDKICICKIDFCFDEDREVTPESRQAIVQVANWLNECPNVKVKVKAYCSREADNAQYNVRLSMARAVTVCNMLIEDCGIQSTRLVPVGMGFGTYKEAYKPESKTRWAKQQNRRVIFEVIEGAGSCKYEPSFDCNPEAPECDKSEYCYRKDGTKFWRVGPHYFTGDRFVEEGGKSIGETYTGWPRSTGPIRPPGLSQGAFNSKLKLELPFGTDLTKRIAWHKAYRIQNPDETQGAAQQTYNVWFDPLTDAKQHFQLEGTAENPIITISGGDTPIDIWARRYNRDTNIVVKGKKTHVNTGFSGKIPGDDGLDNVTYIINPNK